VVEVVASVVLVDVVVVVAWTQAVRLMVAVEAVSRGNSPSTHVVPTMRVTAPTVSPGRVPSDVADPPTGTGFGVKVGLPVAAPVSVVVPMSTVSPTLLVRVQVTSCSPVAVLHD